MILTIWRHGQAGSASSDRLRELTATGRENVAQGGRAFHDACQARFLPLPDRVYYSRWLRTTQTAEIICDTLGMQSMDPAPALLPGSDIPEVDDWLLGLQVQGHLLLVSHQPLVSRLADHYLGSFGQVPSLSPGGLVTLSLEVPARACAKLLFWALPPDYRASV